VVVFTHTQITDIRWTFNHYGPFVYDVIDMAREDGAFEVVPTTNMYGSSKDLIKVCDDVEYPSLDEADKEVLDFVLESAARKNYGEFMHLVYSTYPVATQERYSELDLVELAEGYERATSSLELKP